MLKNPARSGHILEGAYERGSEGASNGRRKRGTKVEREEGRTRGSEEGRVGRREDRKAGRRERGNRGERREGKHRREVGGQPSAGRQTDSQSVRHTHSQPQPHIQIKQRLWCLPGAKMRVEGRDSTATHVHQYLRVAAAAAAAAVQQHHIVITAHGKLREKKTSILMMRSGIENNKLGEKFGRG